MAVRVVPRGVGASATDEDLPAMIHCPARDPYLLFLLLRMGMIAHARDRGDPVIVDMCGERCYVLTAPGGPERLLRPADVMCGFREEIADVAPSLHPGCAPERGTWRFVPVRDTHLLRFAQLEGYRITCRSVVEQNGSARVLVDAEAYDGEVYASLTRSRDGEVPSRALFLVVPTVNPTLDVENASVAVGAHHGATIRTVDRDALWRNSRGSPFPLEVACGGAADPRAPGDHLLRVTAAGREFLVAASSPEVRPSASRISK